MGKIAITKFIKNKVKSQNPNDDPKKVKPIVIEEKELNILEPFNFFGEFGVINSKKRTANARALEDIHLIYLDKDGFDLTFKVRN